MNELEPFFETGNPEWENLQRMIDNDFQRSMRRMALSIVTSQRLGLPAKEAEGLAGAMQELDPEEQARRAAEWEALRLRDRNSLLGAAKEYRIRDPELRSPQELEELVEMHRSFRRESGQKLTTQLHPWLEGAQVFGPSVLDGMLGALQSVPILGDQVAKMRSMNEADQRLAALQERYTSHLSEGGQAVATGVGNMIGYTLPAAVSWWAAGRAMASGLLGARLSGLAKAAQAPGALMRTRVAYGAARGGLAESAIEAGGDGPLQERALNIALGTGFGAGEALGGLYGGLAAGGGFGAILGGVATGGELEGYFGGGAAGAGLVFGLRGSYRMIKMSYPSLFDPPLRPGDPGVSGVYSPYEPRPQPPRASVQVGEVGPPGTGVVPFDGPEGLGGAAASRAPDAPPPLAVIGGQSAPVMLPDGTPGPAAPLALSPMEEAVGLRLLPPGPREEAVAAAVGARNYAVVAPGVIRVSNAVVESVSGPLPQSAVQQTVYTGRNTGYQTEDPSYWDSKALFASGYYSTLDPFIAGGRAVQTPEQLARIRELEVELQDFRDQLLDVQLRLNLERDNTMLLRAQEAFQAEVTAREIELKNLEGQGSDNFFQYAHPKATEVSYYDLPQVISDIEAQIDELDRYVAAAPEEAQWNPQHPDYREVNTSAWRSQEYKKQLVELKARLETGAGETPNVRPARLLIRNPFDMDQPVGSGTLRAVGELLGEPVDGTFSRNEDLWNWLSSRVGGGNEANALLKELGYDGITHIGGARTGYDPHRVWIAWDPSQVYSVFGPAESARLVGTDPRAARPGGPVPLSPVEASLEARQLSRHATFMESPALPEALDRAAAGMLDDGDAAMALLQSFPHAVVVLRNVGDESVAVRRILQEIENGVGPQDFRVVRRQLGPRIVRVASPDWQQGLRGGDLSIYDFETVVGGEKVHIMANYDARKDQLEIEDIYYPDRALTDPSRLRARSVAMGEGWTREAGAELVRQIEAELGHPVGTVAGYRVTGVADQPGAAPRWFRAPARRFRREPRIETDVLISGATPISQKMVADYEAFGFFEKQRVSVMAWGSPIEAEITALGKDSDGAWARVRTPDGAEIEASIDDLLPSRSGAVYEGPQELYDQFRAFADTQLDAQARELGLRPYDLLSDEGAEQFTSLVDTYLNMQGAQNPYQRAALTHFIEGRFADELRALTPVEDQALLNRARAMLAAASGAPRSLSLDELAEARGMRWVPSGRGDSGTLVDELSDLRVPMESEMAARDFLYGFDRELPDAAPASLVPVDIHGPALTGYSDREPHFTDHADEARTTESSLDDMEDAFDDLGMAYGLIPPSGGGGGGRRGPPRRPPSGSGDDPLFLPGEDPAGQHGSEWERLHRDDPRAYAEIMSRAAGVPSRLLKFFRHAAMSLERAGINAGLEWFRPYQLYDEIDTARRVAASMAIPWQQRIGEIHLMIRNKYSRDGTFMKVYTAGRERIPGYGGMTQQQILMDEYGFTPKEREAVQRLQELLVEFSLAEATDALTAVYQFWPARFSRLDYDRFAGGMPDDQSWQELLRKGQMGDRGDNVDTSFVSAFNSFFNIFFKQREMKVPMEKANLLMADPNVPSEIRDFFQSWQKAAYMGIDPSEDKLIRGARSALRGVGIPVTHRDISQFIATAFATQYRGFLGGRADPIIRDLLQLLVPSARIGDFRILGEVLMDYIRRPAARSAMFDRAYAGGWLERDYVKVAQADLFSFNPWEVADEARSFTPEELVRRERIASKWDFVQDRIARPLGLGLGMQGTRYDALQGYAKQGQVARALSGEIGFRKSTRALERYRVALGEGQLDQAARRVLRLKLLKDSGVYMFDPSIKRRFMELVDMGQDSEAVKMYANQVANLQNLYGLVEAPSSIRKAGTIGRLGIQLGSHAQQQIADHASVLSDRSISRAARLGYVARFATVDAALLMGKAVTGWNLKKLLIVGGIMSPVAAPSMWELLNNTQRALAYLKAASGDQVGPDQQALMNSPGSDLLSTFNPWRGYVRTFQGLDEAIASGNPWETAGHFLVTGTRGDPSITRSLEGGVLTQPQQAPWVPPSVPSVIPTGGGPPPWPSVDSILQAHGHPPTAGGGAQ